MVVALDNIKRALIFTKVRGVTKKGGILVIGECDHLGHLMHAFDKKRVFEYKNATIIEEANIDYITLVLFLLLGQFIYLDSH